MDPEGGTPGGDVPAHVRALQIDAALGKTLASLALSIENREERAHLVQQAEAVYETVRRCASTVALNDAERMRIARVLVELEDTLALLRASE
jgi:hypothetical protein